MKHLRRIFVICLAVVMMCCGAVVVQGEGVTYKGLVYPDYHEWVSKDEWEWRKKALKDWLINTPYWAVDIFAPGYSTQNLMNSPDADTIDFDITPYKGTKDTVIVAEIPEEYKNVYNDFISQEIENKGKIEISNITRTNNSIIFDCNASIDLHVGYDPDQPGGFEYLYDDQVLLYAVTIDKKTEEIIRYDRICYGYTIVGGPVSYTDPNKYVINNRMICDFPENYDPEKHEYGFCFIAYYIFPVHDLLYEGDIHLYTLTKVNIPEEFPLGDVTEDGILNLSDASLILKKIARWKNIDFNKYLSDVNADLKTDLNDVTAILKTIAGWYFG